MIKSLVRNSKLLHYLLIALMSLSVGLYFRLYPLLNYSSDELSEKATVLVITKLKSQIQKQIDRKYPTASAKQKTLMVNKFLNEALREDNQKVRESIDRIIEQMQSMPLAVSESNDPQPKRTTPYLLASDSFYYYGLTEKILSEGHFSSQIKGSKYFNDLMLAPQGHWEPFTLHPFVGYYLYRFLKVFNSKISLMHAVSYTPLVLVIFSLVAFLVISWQMQCRFAVTLTGSIYFLLAPIFIKRSTYGWYDNDPYTVFFPLLILSCLFYCIHQMNNRRLSIPLSCLIAILMMLYALFWQGWILLFLVLFVSMILIWLYHVLIAKDTKSRNNLLLFLFIIIGGSFGTISFAFGVQEFFHLFREGGHALKNFLTPQLSPWPDLYISVSELKKGSLNYIIKSTGGIFFLSIVLLGMITSLARIPRERKSEYAYQVIILCVFLISSLAITFGAQRFAIVAFIPMSIFFLLGLQSIQLLWSRLSSRLTINNHTRKMYDFIFSLLIITSIILPIHSLHGSIQSLLNPIFNSTWEKALTQVKAKTPLNSIMTAWWSPGHFIKSIAHRRVTFDGATINVPQAYWVANFFLSQNEKEALGILRMLNNSGNEATEYLEKSGLPLSTAIKILKEITPLDRSQAHALLSKFLTPQKADYLLALTHARPPPSYCLIYNEFVDNNLQLKFIGNWNFQKIEDINADPELLKKLPNRNSKEYVQFLWTLAGGPMKYSGPLTMIGQDENTLLFKNNVSVDLLSFHAQVSSDKFGHGIPFSVFHEKNGHVIETKLKNSTLPYSLILVKNSNNYQIILLERSLAKSMLIQMYFFKATGLSYIKPIIEESDLTQRTKILVYAIDWNQFENDLRSVDHVKMKKTNKGGI